MTDLGRARRAILAGLVCLCLFVALWTEAEGPPREAGTEREWVGR